MIEVLIVEDDPMVSEINKNYLRDIPGYHVMGAVSSVQEALQFLKTDLPDLILLDIFMPEQNGLALLTAIRQQQLDIDVILITAATDIESIHKAIQNGAFDYIIKPFRFDRFKQAMLKYKEQSRVMKEENELSQEELDHLLLEKRGMTGDVILPKGLAKNTLKEIWNFINSKNGDEFTTEDLVEAVGISRISIRKYLTFLEQIDVLTSSCSYGQIGRPLTLFQCKDACDRNVEPYLVN
ncbi:hypothetical protein AC622_02215 [Bacillus sp. FJAT-27916]|uniref:response regulator n=1 Tax=Bacillaceae TaxID=186817 RepID=UPI0006712384|nr:response regulator [Bacillus sp. FJAT-27916]KMY43216.1 hypothetical protein AC622_02215 [Bacillus sp. FJAT-27916]